MSLISAKQLGREKVVTPIKIARDTGTAGTTTSATYVDMAGPVEVTFQKQEPGSSLLVLLYVAFYSTAVNTGATIGVRVDGGSDTDVFSATASTANAWYHASGSVGLSGLSVGSHTIRARWFRWVGSGTLTLGSGGYTHLIVSEVTT